jgi:phage tail-like protein
MSVPLRLTPSTLDQLLLQPAVRGTTPTVTFARPRSSDTNLFTWFQSAQRGLPGARKNGAIIAHDFNYNNVIGKWNFTNGWPAKWHVEYPAGGDVAMEVVTIAYEHISRG